MLHFRRTILKSLCTIRPLIVFNAISLSTYNTFQNDDTGVYWPDRSEKKQTHNPNNYVEDIQDFVNMMSYIQNILKDSVEQITLRKSFDRKCIIKYVDYLGTLGVEYYQPDGKVEYKLQISNNTIFTHFPNGVCVRCFYNIVHGKLKYIREYVVDDTIKYHGKYIEYSNDGDMRINVKFDHGVIAEIYKLEDEQNRDCVIKSREIVVWKVCKTDDDKKVYVKLLVPMTAGRKNANITDFSCIIEYAKVLEIVDKEGKQYPSAKNFIYRNNTINYVVGQTVTADNYDKDSGGIYVYLYKDHCNKLI